MTNVLAVPTFPFKLPPLRFGYDALEPHIDAKTMRLHHEVLHQSYIDRLNATIENVPSLHGLSIEAILRGLDQVPERIRTAVRNQGGGHANHQFFWKIIGPASTRPHGPLLSAVNAEFGSVENLRVRFMEAALSRFGVGWVFLVLDPASQRLEILSLPNHDSVLSIGKPGLLICDLWEHAYLFDYHNRRADYLKAFWNVIDWNVVGGRLAAFRGDARMVV